MGKGEGLLIDTLGQDCCCPPPKPILVACCGPDGDCSMNTAEDCLLAGRDPQAPGTDCETFECPGLPGGCPILDESCDLTNIRIRATGLDVVYTPNGATWPTFCESLCPFNGSTGWESGMLPSGGSCQGTNDPPAWQWFHGGTLFCMGNAPDAEWIAQSIITAQDGALFLEVIVTATKQAVAETCPGVSPGYVVQDIAVNTPDLAVGGTGTFFVTS